MCVGVLKLYFNCVQIVLRLNLFRSSWFKLRLKFVRVVFRFVPMLFVQIVFEDVRVVSCLNLFRFSLFSVVFRFA